MSVRSSIVAVGRCALSVVNHVLAALVILQVTIPAGAAATSSAEHGVAEKRSAGPEATSEPGSAKSPVPGGVSIQVINLPPKTPLSSGEASEQATPRPAKKGKPTASGQSKNSQAKRRGTPPCLAWVDADVEPRAVLLCVHGLGLYNGTYE